MKFAIITKMNTLKQSHKQRGDAIVAVLCILAILLALSAALLVSTNIVVNNNAEYKDQIQCKLAANSFAKTLQDKLGDNQDELTKAVESLLNSKTWTYYNDEIPGQGHSEADRKFGFDDGDFNHSIVMHYEADEDTANDPSAFELVLELTTTYKNQRYKIVSRFNRYEDKNDKNIFYWYLSWNSNDADTGKGDGN